MYSEELKQDYVIRHDGALVFADGIVYSPLEIKLLSALKNKFSGYSDKLNKIHKFKKTFNCEIEDIKC